MIFSYEYKVVYSDDSSDDGQDGDGLKLCWNWVVNVKKQQQQQQAYILQIR